MFRFQGYLDRRGFALAALVRIVLFAASVAGFPLILQAVGAISNCRSVGGACGAVGLMTAVAFKPLAFAVFVFSFIGITLRRARDAGFPAWTGLLIPLLIAADIQVLVFGFAPWSLAFSAGVLGLPRPWYLALALYAIVLLSLVPSRPQQPWRGHGIVDWLALALAVPVLGVAALSRAILLEPSLMLTHHAVMRWLAQYGITPERMSLVFAAVLAGVAWQAWRAAPDGPIARPAPDPAAARPYKIIAALALLLTVVAFLGGNRDMNLGLALLALLPSLPTMLLPTFALYLCILIALYRLATRRSIIAAVLVLIAVLPFVHWGSVYRDVTHRHQAEAAELAALPRVRPQRVPSVLVLDKQGMRRKTWDVPGIERVIERRRAGATLVAFDRPPPRGRSRPSVPLEALPDEYLLLRMGRDSSFARRGQIYPPDGGPFELRLVGNGRDELLAVWYHAHDPRPTVPPLLTVFGWYRGASSVDSRAVDARLVQFLTDALAPARGS